MNLPWVVAALSLPFSILLNSLNPSLFTSSEEKGNNKKKRHFREGGRGPSQRGLHAKVQILKEVLREKLCKETFRVGYLVKSWASIRTKAGPLSKLQIYRFFLAFGFAEEGKLREGQTVRVENKDQKLLFVREK